MAIDTPARLAVVGAGPIGLEAALYGRFLGYDVDVYEAGDVAAAVRHWGHVRMFAPFGLNRTSLGLAAIQAHDEAFQPPRDDEFLSGHEWADRYLMPLAQTDLVSDRLRLKTTVVAIGKEELLKHDLNGQAERGDWAFRVLSRDAVGQERVDVFDGVLDCSGVYATANFFGPGGIPAIGEIMLRDQIEYRLPAVLGRDRERYAGKHTLVIGAGMSAATNVVALAELAQSAAGTRVTWITRREGPAGAGGPVAMSEHDPLPERLALARRANQIAANDNNVTYWPRTTVEQLSRASDGSSFTIQLAGDHAGTIQADEVIANVGFRPNLSICEELQFQISDSSSTPLQPEPNYYILGTKSFGRRSDFLLADGYQQIRQVFAILGDRDSLDLYTSAKQLLR